MTSKLSHNKQQKRLTILTAAQQLFLTQGFELTSMDAVALQAGVTKQTVYRYFDSKLSLFAAVLQLLGEQPEYDFAPLWQQSEPQVVLRQFATQFVAGHLSPAHLALTRLLISESPRQPQLTEPFWQQGPQSLEQQLAAFLLRHFDLQPAQATAYVDYFTAMLLAPQQRLLLGTAPLTEAQLQQHIDGVLGLFLAGLEPRSA
ncbi:TetR/AcrR family transcriptional regulator [Ferrimonas senticii]|uniref:TetR/AcrR family transcriptional regulator n=1 Tax=Ferrimonas senticii TaxID=394566 RepID=UPI000419AB5D|nr:TetR/AcrR family transcriptional regulator [Ferrimonas senticii]